MTIEAILFSSTNCGICKVLQPKLTALFAEYSGVDFKTVKTDQNIEFASQNGVFMVPVLIIKADGKEAFRFIKSFSLFQVKEKLEKLFPPQ